MRVNKLYWFDVDGTQTVNGVETSIFASFIGWSEDDARAQFFKKFPYGRIERIRFIGENRND